MARFKPYDLNQTKMIPLSYADQVLEGSFEYALNEIVEEHLDLSVFEHRYHNDATGRLAFDPKVLLKILLYGYYLAIDGCKLPSNASKKWSGMHKELDEKRKKLERVAQRIVQRGIASVTGRSRRAPPPLNPRTLAAIARRLPRSKTSSKRTRRSVTRPVTSRRAI